MIAESKSETTSDKYFDKLKSMQTYATNLLNLFIFCIPHLIDLFFIFLEILRNKLWYYIINLFK